MQCDASPEDRAFFKLKRLFRILRSFCFQPSHGEPNDASNDKMAVRNQPLKILDDYYLLPTGANIERFDKLLGRVVENHVYPLTRYEPDDDLIPQKLVPKLMGNSNALESVKETSRKDQKSEARLKARFSHPFPF